jgi:DNA-binding XRE family transcriptional regulator
VGYNGHMDIQIIGNQIADRRKEKGLSQVALAQMCAVTPQAVNKWEKGKSLPDIFMLAKISDILGIYDIRYFLGGDCENFTTIKQFVEYWQSCSVKGLEKIAQKYGVDFCEHDTKEIIIEKLTNGMNEYCKEK